MSERKSNAIPTTLPPRPRLWLVRLPRRFGVMSVATAALLLTAVALLLPAVGVAAQDASSDASLSNLYISGSPFTEPFDPARTEYAATVGQDQSKAYVRAQVNHPEAGAAITGAQAVPGGWFIVSLAPRPASISVVVTAEDGSTTRTYTIGIDGQLPAPAPDEPTATPTPTSSPTPTPTATPTPTPTPTPTATPTATPAPVEQEPPADKPPQQQQQDTDCPVPADGDYDADDDGLIEVCNLAQLNAIRWDANGDGYAGYGWITAFPDPTFWFRGCPSSGCNGYELTADLDFDTNGNGEADAGDTYWNGGKGWTPINYGIGNPIVFEGNGNTISNLFINVGRGENTGLFGSINGAIIRNLGLLSVDASGQGAAGGLAAVNRGEIHGSYVHGSVSGQRRVGGLAASNHGKIIGSHTTGTVSGGRSVGGLVGRSTGLIQDSYSTADVSVTGAKPSGRKSHGVNVMETAYGDWVGAFGGLVGEEVGTIRGSYAAGDVTASEAFVVGGLAGFIMQDGDVFASYAAGDVSGAVYVGGLVGRNGGGPITASYALGSVSGVDYVGGLVGKHPLVYPEDNHHRCSSCAIHSSGITDSYWNLQAEGQTATHTLHRDTFATSPPGADQTTAELQTPTDYTGIYANWNDLTDGKGSSDLWDFGTSSQYPVLKNVGPGLAEQRAQLPEPSTDPVLREAPTGPGTDYDVDDDGLIEVSNLDQLNAIRLDGDGDGYGCCHYSRFRPSPYRGDPNVPNPERWDTPAAFPDPMSGMGCPRSGCIGYELVTDLDFDTNGNGKADAGDAYYDGSPHSGWDVDNGWRPIWPFSGVFDGNGHTIRNLYISSPKYENGPVRAGLFNEITFIGVVRNLALENVSVSGGGYPVGGLAGSNSGRISGVYVTGTVSGGLDVGGLVGQNSGSIIATYSTASVTGSGNNAGGLVGHNWGGVTASYANGAVTGSGNNVGGLTGSGGATNSYWDTQTSGRSGGGAGKTTAELQTPTGYTGIYANWNVDTDGDKTADDPWEFGSDSEYPTLKGVGDDAPPEETPGDPQPPEDTAKAQGTFSVSASASAAEGDDATLTITLSAAAPADGVAFAVTADYSGAATATALDVGSITSPVTVAEGDTTQAITIPTVDDDMDEDDETFSIVIAAATPGWEKEGDGKDTATITITDDDTAGVTVNPTALTIGEGGTGTYTVVLDSAPGNLVTIVASSGDTGAVSVDPETYVISPSDWSVPRTFTVSGMADADATDESVTISHSVNGYQDAKYNGVTVPSLSVAVQDTTPTNFAVSRTASAAEGSDATLIVTLTATAPTGGVEFGVSADYSGSASDADVGDLPQTVTVAAGRTTATLTIALATDALEEGDETFTVTLTPPSGWTVASAGDAAATVTITDVAPPEGEAPAEPDPMEIPGPVVNLQLSTKGKKVIASWEVPASGGAVDNYIAHLKPADGGNGKTHRPQAGKTTTTFRNLEPGVTYKVWVRAQNDAGRGERVHGSITLPDGVVQGGEGDPPPEQQQTARTFSVSAAASPTEGTNAALTVTLSEAAPAGGVAFTVTAGYSGQTAEAADVGSITSPVTVGEGETALDISVPIADDAVDEDDETFTVTIAAATAGWEKAGNGRDTATVTITDDDTAGVTVTPTALSVAEDGSATYTVVLDSKPTADVTVTPTGSGGAASFAPTSHTFTPSDWNTPQTFTVSGVADEDRDNETVDISHRVTGGDGKYDGIAVASVAVTVSDTTPPASEETGPPVAGQTEPYNVQVTPGDGTLTVTWSVAPREGVSNDEIKHTLRWSQQSGVWANPPGPSGAPENGIVVEGGVASYTITGLENGVATGVFVRSFTGNSYSERSQHSSQWVRVKGENTTPKAAE